MRAIRYHKSGTPSVLQIDEIKQPEPGPNEVLVKTRAASVNPVDGVVRNLSQTNHPKTTGSDLAGRVKAVGDGVTTYENGDRVFATGLHAERFSGGSFADYVIVPTDLLSPLPKEVSFKEGAAIALVGVTAWRAFINHADIEPGETVLIHGGNGGVGHIAIQIASLMGASVVATARPKHYSTIREFGADFAFDYTRDDLGKAIKSECGGVDVILDHFPKRDINTNIDVLNLEGDIVVIAGKEMTISDITSIRQKEIDLHMMSVTNLVTHRDLPNIGKILTYISRLLANGQLSVEIDRVYDFDTAEKAYRALQEDSIVGKIVVEP
ncbi:quinone oxidoreductase family protein [Halostagnicola kamekurae]|uniref:NADPH:quinone reductase n=1 Tax=Halostagnicola kamekurae TaxID=619731 RepID=A0A1I6TSA4_9EURY|nr:NADPH:quinone reductase [Halostagnicola kamekurae]SFS92044.1 NADPH:quinone reductase [Halostagnicola kamekurae]